MRIFFWVWVLFPLSLWAQPEEDCRVKDADFQPIIARFNPFFTEHKWSVTGRKETARTDAHRVLTIAQHGCKRHHFIFDLYVSKEIAEPNTDFWIQEAVSMMRAVFQNKREFREFQQEFEEIFLDKMEINGVDKEFNFPVGSRNFICEVESSVESNSLLHIEMIEYVFEEMVKEARKPNTQDDGWYIAPLIKPRPTATSPLVPFGTPLPEKPSGR